MRKLSDALLKKSFNLEFGTLTTPTEAEIREAIQNYAKGSDVTVAFISEKMPISFRLNNTVYVAHRGTSRGGPIVYCVEE